MTKKDGRPCRKCGTSEWDKRGNCRQCSRDRTAQWQRENPKKVQESSRRYYHANLEKSHDRGRRWQKANPEKHVAKQHRRRTRVSGAGGSYTPAEWKALTKQQKGRCLACGKKKRLTADHIIPVIAGGSSDISNIQGLCGPCNSSKGAKTIDYRKEGGFLRWIQEKLL